MKTIILAGGATGTGLYPFTCAATSSFSRVGNKPVVYDVVKFDAPGHALSLEERPIRPESNCAVKGY